MSNIDLTVPPEGEATTLAVRDNFAIAANEIDAATALAISKLSDAPSDGTMYARINGVWQPVPASSTALPLVNGAAAAGASNAWARGDHVHPIDTSRAPLNSPALTGAPTAPTPGAADNSSALATTAFVQTVAATLSGATTNNTGRNLAHNPFCLISQRGAGPWTVGGQYPIDRWMMNFQAPDTHSTLLVSLPDADRIALGDERAQVGVQSTFTGTATGFADLLHRVENVRRLSGKTVNVSFFAKATAGAPRIGIGWLQWFGTGGSPSPSVMGNIAVSPVIAAGIARYGPFPITLPVTTGKTLGNNADSFTEFSLFLSNGINDTRGGAIGAQTGTVVVWGLCVEGGSLMSPLEQRDLGHDLRDCQRFFQRHVSVLCSTTYAQNNVGPLTDFSFPVMRNVPSVTFDTIQYSNASALAANLVAQTHVQLIAQASSAGASWAMASMNLASDL